MNKRIDLLFSRPAGGFVQLAVLACLLSTVLARFASAHGGGSPPKKEKPAQKSTGLLAGPSKNLGPKKALSKIDVVDRIVAVVDNHIITLRELRKEAHDILQKTPADKQNEALRKVLDIKIDERLMKIELEKSKDQLGIGESEIDAAVSEVLRRNNMTTEQLQAALYGQGLTWSEYRTQLRTQLERARLVNFRLQGRVNITLEDARRECETQNKIQAKERVCASHILLKLGPKEKAETVRAKAAQLQSELASGGDFATYALKYSDDKSAPDGSLGCFGPGEMMEAFEEAAFKTPTGKISDIVRTSFGFHIIKVTSRERAPSACDDEANLNRFRNELYGRAVEKQTLVWMKELRQAAFVEMRL